LGEGPVLQARRAAGDEVDDGSGAREEDADVEAPPGALTGAAERRLSPAATAFRTFHAAIALVFLAEIAYVWWCALTGRRDRLLRIAVGSLAAEGAVVTANHGDCPLGPLQDKLHDPVPLFELVLSARAAKLAVPVLGGITATGVALLWLRDPRRL
jgi:hypothetical protein